MNQGVQLLIGIALGFVVLAVIGVVIGAPTVAFVILAIALIGAAISILGGQSRQRR